MPVKKRPGFDVNVERTQKSTASRSIYFDIAAGQKVDFRFTPPSQEDGSLFFESAQHFRFKQDGEKRAWACLRQHGDGTQECPICEAVENVSALGYDEEKEKRFVGDFGVSLRWHAQVVPVEYAYKIVDGQEIAEIIPATQTFVVGLSKTTAGKVSKILRGEKDRRKPLLTNVEKGQIITIERNNGVGYATRYEVMATGDRVNLDELCPTWADKYLTVEDALKLRITDRDTLIESMRETWGDAKVDKLLG